MARRWLRAAVATAAAGFAWPADASISGRVLRTDGTPVPGAIVEALEHESSQQTAERRAAGRARTPLATVTAGADGTFRLEWTRTSASLQVSAEGYAPDVILADDGVPAQVTLARASLRRGVIRSGGKPISGALVFWVGMGGAERLTRTGGDGTFEAPDPAVATAQMLVLHPDFAPLDTYVGGEPVEKGLDQQLEAGLAIQGTAVDDRTGAPVAGAPVFLDEWAAARTNEKGAFVIPHASGDWERVSVRTARLTGTARRKSGPLAVRLKPARTLQGRVTDADTRQPLSGATVTVDDLTAATNDRGEYTLNGLSPGRYDASINRAGYAPAQRAEANEQLDLRAAVSARFDAALKRLPLVQGRVEDEQHRPVEGALVSLGAKGSPHVYAPSSSVALMSDDTSTRTSPDGSFRLAIPISEPDQDVAQELKDQRLTVLKQGFAAARLPVAAQGRGSSPTVVTLSRGVELAGRIAAPDGRPIPGVAVTAAEDVTAEASALPSPMLLVGRKDDGWVTSDESGRFAINVHPVAHRLFFRKSGYAPVLSRAHDPRDGRALEVVLQPAARVHGRVSRADGRPVAEALVGVSTSPTMAEPDPVATAADGTFEIADLSPGFYQLVVTHEGLGVQETRTVEAPDADVQIVLKPMVTLRGHVLDAATRRPVPRFRLTVVSADGNSVRSVQAEGPSGGFTVEDVVVGNATVRVTAEGYATKGVDDVALEEGGDPPALEVLLEGDAPLRGRVTSQVGQPIADVTVRARGNSHTETDEDGEYELRGQPPGELALTFSAAGYIGEKRTIDTRESTRLDVTLKRGLTLRGEVVTGRVGVPDAYVSATSSGAGASYQSAETDAEGRFTLEGLVPGRYTISANASSRGQARMEDVDVETAGPLRLTLEKASTAIIHGRVVGLSEAEDAMTAVSASSDETGESSEAFADSSHAFRIEDAPAGRVNVSAVSVSLAGGVTRHSRTVVLSVAPGGEIETVVEFGRDITVTGTVTRGGAVVPFVRVDFSDDGSEGVAVVTDGRGFYQAELDPGSYNVRLSGEGVSYRTEYVATESAEFDIDVTGGSLVGRVVRADGGTPLQDVDVSYFRLGGGENRPEGSASTNSQGVFSERSLREGRYRLITSKAGFGQEVRDVEVPRGGSAEVVIELAPADGVTVTVVDARDSRPLEAIVVVRDQARRIVANRHAGADASGALNIPLADGTYLLSTSANGYGTVTLPVTAPTQGLKVGLTPGGTLVIESARELRGRVRLVQPDGEEYVRCWCNGIAEIQLKGRRTSVENVTPGSYTVEIVDAPEAMAPRLVVIREGQTSTVAVE